jgi:hypothetical protein
MPAMQTPLCTEAEQVVGLVYVPDEASAGEAMNTPEIASTRVPIAIRDACVHGSRRVLILSVCCSDGDRIVTW